MASPNLSELITTTLRYREPTIADNFTNHNALLRRMKDRGHIKKVDGGRTLVTPLEYAENATFQYYSGYEALDISPSDVISAAEYNWKQASVNVTISGLEGDIQNAGKEQLHDLLEVRIKNSERTMMNNLSTGLYADGTGTSSKEIGGLQHIVADTATSGSVGGIARGTYSFWQNISFDATDDGGAAATNSNITGYMNQVWVQVVRGNDMPDMIVADNNYWRFYLESLQAIQRITNDTSAQAGFRSLDYMGAPLFFDTGGGCPTNHMYFLNTEYLYLKVHRNRNMTALPNKSAVNQDAVVVPMVWAGNMCCSNSSLQAVLKD